MDAVTRPVWAEVDLDNIRHQIRKISDHIGSRPEIMAVVKADGYGHGALPVAEAALEAGAGRLAVALPEEGMELRAAGISAPIQVLGEIDRNQARIILEYDLIPTICRQDTPEFLQKLASENEKTVPAVIKIDTGMGRIGIQPEELNSYYEKITSFSRLKVDSLMTHFATADEKNKEFTREQYRRFEKAVQKLRENKDKGLEINCQVANSATVIDLPEYSLDIVRPGIMLYGLPPSREVDQSFDLKPVLELKAKIAYLKRVPSGTPISYGSTYITEREAEIATLPLGYADGYPRLLSNQADVLVNGKRAPVRGRVCMDQLMIDVSDISQVEEGQEVTLIGREGDSEITAGELAEMIGTINYEIVSRLGKRVPRIYLNQT